MFSSSYRSSNGYFHLVVGPMSAGQTIFEVRAEYTRLDLSAWLSLRLTLSKSHRAATLYLPLNLQPASICQPRKMPGIARSEKGNLSVQCAEPGAGT